MNKIYCKNCTYYTDNKCCLFNTDTTPNNYCEDGKVECLECYSSKVDYVRSTASSSIDTVTEHYKCSECGSDFSVETGV